MKQTFYSHGKLLITGEYLVLDGAKALAIPTKFGQFLTVTENDTNFITWKSLDLDNQIWFESDLYWDEIVENKIIRNYSQVKKTLIQILHCAYLLRNNNKHLFKKGLVVQTQLTFPKNWGLGTSSTLINNIAKWFQVDAFELLNQSFGGSGYDIACAESPKPIIYQRINQKPVVSTVDFYPDFFGHIYFVYLNQKQNSNAAINSYFNKRQNVNSQIETIDAITNGIINCKKLDIFQKLLEKHEAVMSNVLEMQTVQEVYFNDFQGVVKSLGAWGGDFVLVVSDINPVKYFESKGFKTIIKFQDMIL
jgi:mevalonate kinase